MILIYPAPGSGRLPQYASASKPIPALASVQVTGAARRLHLGLVSESQRP